jgi:phospholipase C
MPPAIEGMRLSTFLLAIVLSVAAPSVTVAKKGDPPPARSGIQHIVVVMMENRSFDHLLGWLPNADGRQSGLTYVDAAGVVHETMPLAPDFQGCGHPDPDHSWTGGRVELDGGAMDGFLRAGMNDTYSIGYYQEPDRPFFNAFARSFTTCDRFFAGILAETFPNRVFQHAAQTDRLENTTDLSTLPTIWDRLAAKGISAAYYFSDVPFLALWGVKYVPIMRTYEQFLADAAAGTLPHVSFVDPRFLDEESGTSGDDHPHADVRAGDAFLAEAFHAVASSPQWKHTVFVATYDEWGGFFEHVAPPRAAAPNAVDPDVEGGKTLLGFRVPVVVASPWSRGNADDPRVVSTTFDHTSVLKLIEWRWNLPPLTARDASADVGNLVDVLDLAHPDARVPTLPVPPPPPIVPCAATGGAPDHAFEALATQFIAR